jgi:hypothetical protein
MKRVMVTKITRLTHKIAIQLHLVAESCTIFSYRSRWPVPKLLDTPSYCEKIYIYIYIYIYICQQHPQIFCNILEHSEYLTKCNEESIDIVQYGHHYNSTLVSAWEFFSSPLRPERLCVPPSLLSIGHRGSFPGSKAAGT